MSTFDLSDVVDCMATDTYVLTRPGPAVYVGGRLQTPTTTTLTLDMSVQPLSGQDLLKLPEGARLQDGLTFFSTLAPLPFDTVAVDGATFEVHHVERWGNVGNYWRSLALKTGH